MNEEDLKAEQELHAAWEEYKRARVAAWLQGHPIDALCLARYRHQARATAALDKAEAAEKRAEDAEKKKAAQEGVK